ncbi:MAG: (2Fe-2S)-binding protein [Kiritimatiellae bacterium]|nr:(2Fe-2S)-binding protein [Kiritimatiellia bacterium]
MPRLQIDEREVEVPEGATVLDACRALGIEIPTMCHRDGVPHFTSCMICVVRATGSGRMLPSCSTPAQDGMILETDSEPVREHRRAALELLLSDHLGDCEGPCRRGCPAHMDIPLMIRQIAAGELEAAIATIKADIALPAVLGRICPAPCEKTCRRRQIDEPVAICLLKRFVADTDLGRGAPFVPARSGNSGKRVAIVGAGPAGLAAAYHLLQQGHACTIFDEQEEAGGAIRREIPEAKLPRSVLDAELDVIRALGAEFRLGTRVGRDLSVAQIRAEYDALVLAVGPVDAEAACVFGVKATKRGIQVDSHTLQTDDHAVFAGGGAVGGGRMAVRAVADGKRIAIGVDLFLSGGPVSGAIERFNSVIGRIRDEEKQAFLAQAVADGTVTPAGGLESGFTDTEAACEAGRCLHCDCRKPETCRLRRYAEAYGARQARFKPAERRLFEQVVQHPDVVFEPGKCISCGLCVRITEQRRAALGLAFLGRGIATRVGVPFGESLADGLKEAAKECVEACPTGALAFR